MDKGLPSYAELPLRRGLPVSWGLWGDGDVLGTLNLLTAERALAAGREVRTGRVFPLDLPLAEPHPPIFGRTPIRQRVTKDPGFGGISWFQDDVLENFNTQVSTQWDGFRHVGAVDHGYYSGIEDDRHGIHHWHKHGLVGRAVLADVGRWRAKAGRPIRCDGADVIEAAEVSKCLEDQRTSVEPGDFLLIRTGWLTWWRGLALVEREERAAEAISYPGLAPGGSSAEMLWDLHVAAVAADAPALEVGPASSVLAAFDAPADGDAESARAERTVLHVRLLVLLGTPIGELFDLDALAEDCAADGRYSCMMTSSPLGIQGGIGSPPNAIAIK